MGSHTMNVPDAIWQWAKGKSNTTNPSSWIRDKLYQIMINEIENSIEKPAENASGIFIDEDTVTEDMWGQYNCSLNNFDLLFNRARASFVHAHGSEYAAYNWIEEATKERNLQNPRAFIVSWYKSLP